MKKLASFLMIFPTRTPTQISCGYSETTETSVTTTIPPYKQIWVPQVQISRLHRRVQPKAAGKSN